MKETSAMDRARFSALADAYGGDLDRWPLSDQAAGRARLAQDPSLQVVLARAAELDAFLDAAPEPSLSGVLRERLIASAPRRAGLRPAQRWFGGAILAAACAAGVAVGANFSDRLITDPTSETISQASTSFDNQSDLLGLGEIG